jgi:hypothetical protein
LIASLPEPPLRFVAGADAPLEAMNMQARFFSNKLVHFVSYRVRLRLTMNKKQLNIF